MRKRTRIAVVAAALAFGTVAASVVVAAGSDRAATDRAQTGGTVAGQHVGDGVQPVLAGAPPMDWKLVNGVVRGLKGQIASSQRRGELIDMACKVKDMVVVKQAPPSIQDQFRFPPPIATPPSWLDRLTKPQPPTLEQWRDQEIKARLQAMAGWGQSTASQQASLRSLISDLAQADDYGEGAKLGVDLFCWGTGLYVGAQSS